MKKKFKIGFFIDLIPYYKNVLSEKDIKKLDKFPINLKIMKVKKLDDDYY